MKFILKNGDSFIGAFNNLKLAGPVSYTFSDGYSIDATYSDVGEVEGEVSMRHPITKIRISGVFKGEGVDLSICKVLYRDGSIYKGPVSESLLPHGAGVLEFSENEEILRFEGNFVDGLPSSGTLTFKNDDTFTGPISPSGIFLPPSTYKTKVC